MALLNLNPALKTCSLHPQTGSLILPAGRMQYPNLFEARAMKGETADAKFSVSILIPRDADLGIATAYVANLAAEKWGPKPNKVIKNPFLDHTKKTNDAELAAAFPIMLRCSSTTKPHVVYGNTDECTSPNEVYSGRWALVSVRGYTWDHPTGGRGVSFGLNSVMLLDHDDPIGNARPKPETDFAQYVTITAGGSPDKMFETAQHEALGGLKKLASSIELFN